MTSFLRKHVFNNLLLKLLSLGVAVLMWTAVAREPVAEVAVTVPIEFQHVPDNIEISSEKIPEAQVRVRGPGNTLRQLAQSEVNAVIDLAAVQPGEHTYDLRSQVRVPRDAEVIQVLPAQLHLSLDRRGTKEVPVRARVLGLYAAGPGARIAVEPATAMIIGPEKRIQSVDSAFTDAVDVAGVMGSAAFPGVHLYVADPLVRVARPATVTVLVNAESNGKPAASGRR